MVIMYILLHLGSCAVCVVRMVQLCYFLFKLLDLTLFSFGILLQRRETQFWFVFALRRLSLCVFLTPSGGRGHKNTVCVLYKLLG